MAETWDETKPAGSRSPKLGDDDIREFKRAVRERLAFDHEFADTESPAFGAANSLIGSHNAIRLNEQASDPTTLANQGALYAKEADSATELFMLPESDGTPAQLTRGGMQKLNALAFNDGTQDIAFPTNGMGAAKFMLGDADTIAWFYLATAPPGWKVQALAANGRVLAVAGSSDATYTTGGEGAGTWAQPDHTHTGPSHTHTITHAVPYYADGATGVAAASLSTNAGGTGNTGASATASSWRPAAHVGKLFKLDEA